MLNKTALLPLAIIISVISAPPAPAQSTAHSGIYQIVSGTYWQIGGIVPLRYSLPNEQQMFIRLSVNAEPRDPTMTILGADMQTVFSAMRCPPASRVPFSFDHGLVFSNRIVFHVDPGPYATWWNYTVSNSADSLRIDGILQFDPALCADLPNRFMHTNVVAVLMPTAAVRVSEVEVCWQSFSNRTYQVQYRSTLTTNMWTNLGPPRPGVGGTDCIADKVEPGQPQRFYRIIIVP
jgi:hypothetical protein